MLKHRMPTFLAAQGKCHGNTTSGSLWREKIIPPGNVQFPGSLNYALNSSYSQHMQGNVRDASKKFRGGGKVILLTM